MRVIGAGFGRTGTMSLKAALDEIGFGPCYHMVEVFKHAEHDDLWQKASEGKTVDWRDLFADYESAVDWPACTFYRQLMDEYPEAKVVLTVREPVRWYESVRNTIYMASAHMDRDQHHRMIDAVVWRGTFGGRFEDKAHAISVFERHNSEVMRRVPHDQLLCFDVKQGWGPLCRFLGVEVPKDKPFPHLNDSESFLRMSSARP